MQTDFLHKQVLDRDVHRLGLACNYGIDADGIRTALTEYGLNYVYWTPTMGKATPVLRDVIATDRERYVIASGPTLGWFGGAIRRGVERSLRLLKTDYLDLYMLHWLGITSAYTEGTVATLTRLKEEGKIRAIGCSIHDRERAGRLAEDSALDAFMIRYNAAHPGAERDIFPHLETRHPAVIAYTATRWRKLLRRPSGWKGNVPTAGDCYRFCLSSPHVDVTLCGPKSLAQLDENLAGLAKGPLSEEEMAWMREFGRVVHG